MSQVDPVYRAIEFVENNLQEEIAVADIAEAVSYSLYHFCRVFSQVVHHSPYDYLMRRRLSESACELVETDKKITDIAFDYQFNSPETYSRAFKRMFGMQPNQWKKQGLIDRRALLSPLTLAHLHRINQGDDLKPVFSQKNAIHLVGVMTQIGENAAETIAQLWVVLTQELDTNEAVTPGDFYGVIWYPPNEDQYYMAAVEIETPDVMSPALVTKTLPALNYARFIHKGPWRERQLTLDYIYQTWLPKSNQQLAFPLEIERYENGFQHTGGPEAETKIYLPLK